MRCCLLACSSYIRWSTFGFGSYRIVSRYFVWYRIVSNRVPYGCIVPSLKGTTVNIFFIAYRVPAIPSALVCHWTGCLAWSDTQVLMPWEICLHSLLQDCKRADWWAVLAYSAGVSLDCSKEYVFWLWIELGSVLGLAIYFCLGLWL